MRKFEKKVSITVPVYDNDGKEIDSQNLADIIKSLTEHVQGCTVTENVGIWISDKMAVEEKNQVFTWCMRYISNFIACELVAIVDELIIKHGQECVFIEIDGIGYLAYSSDELKEFFKESGEWYN